MSIHLEAYPDLVLFRGVPFDRVRQVLEQCPVRTLEAEEILLDPARTNSFLFFVLDGRLTVHHRTPTTPKVVDIGRGECVGELSLIDDQPASAYVKAAVATRVLVVSKEAFLRVGESSRDIYLNLLEVFTQRMRFNIEALVESRFVRTVPDIIYRLDREGRFIFLNESIEKLGYAVDELLGRHFRELLPEDEFRRASYEGVVTHLREHGTFPESPPKLFDERRSDHRKTMGLELKVKTKLRREADPDLPEVVPPDMIVADVSCTGISMADDGQDPDKYVGTIGIIRDVTERKIHQAQLADQKSRMEAIFNTMTDALVVIESHGIIESVNTSAMEMFGYSEEEMVGNNVSMLMPSPMREEHDGYLRRYFDSGESLIIGNRREMTAVRKDGTEFHIDIAVSSVQLQHRVLFTGIIRDITERKEAERLIHYQANYDTLTDLPNRSMFMRTMEEAVDEVMETREAVALAFIDLDRFKWVNDNMGHAAGDQLLQAAAKRIQECLGQGDLVGRLGGDEFTVLLRDAGEDRALVAARQILDGLNRAFRLDGEDVYISGSLGVALLPRDAASTEELLKRADEAMYRSKNAGRNACHFFGGASFSRKKKY